MSRAGVIMNGGARPRRPEQEIHRAVVQHLRTRAAPGLVWNSRSKRRIPAASRSRNF